MKSLMMVAVMLVSGVAFAQGGAKMDTKAAKAECKADAKKNGKKLSKAELKECVKAKVQ